MADGFDQHHGLAAVRVAVRPVGDPETAEFSARALDQAFEAAVQRGSDEFRAGCHYRFYVTYVVQDIGNTISSYELCRVIQLSFESFYAI